MIPSNIFLKILVSLYKKLPSSAWRMHGGRQQPIDERSNPELVTSVELHQFIPAEELASGVRKFYNFKLVGSLSTDVS